MPLQELCDLFCQYLSDQLIKRCAKVCKNPTGLKIHQTKMACLEVGKVKQHTGAVASTTGKVLVTVPGQTEEEPGSEPPHSVQNLQAAPVFPQSGKSEQRRVKWPAANIKEWLQLIEDIDKIMETTGKGNVDHKLQAMCTFITTIGAERFGVTERPVRKESARPNRWEHKSSQLRQELKTLKRQFRAASEEERDLRQILRRKLITLRRAEWHRRKGKERAKKRKAFITNPFSFTKRLLGQKKSGSLTCPMGD
ncbi:uncharacterized protein [Takifugu rubripes]|uniref:uncharacterized protein n=1 Tax=Takifugu rubripes TaxID=31033 RepID=UPI001145DFE0|nr:uncharacterized protein LOC115250215 [Takifugu rubripes]